MLTMPYIGVGIGMPEMLMPSFVKGDGKTCNQRTSSFSSIGGGSVILKVWVVASHKLNDTLLDELRRLQIRPLVF